MGARQYLEQVSQLLESLRTQDTIIRAVAQQAAITIEEGRWVRLFGSGHSVLPIQDCFPRYGGFVGFDPMMDPRLMWTVVSGPGGAEELLWLERQEGYMEVFLRHVTWQTGDMLVIVSHGGQNAAPVEVALAAKQRGLYVVAVTSIDNHRHRCATHSSGKKIGDVADVIVDTGVPSDDALVTVPGVPGKVAGASTLMAIAVIQAIVAETAVQLTQRGYRVIPFASPNSVDVESDRSARVYEAYRQRLAETLARG